MHVEIKYTVNLSDVEHTYEDLDNFIRCHLMLDSRIKSPLNPFIGDSLHAMYGTLSWEYIGVDEDLLMDDD